jgi:hypothetical protein
LKNWNLSKALRREINHTAKRGPRPEEMGLLKRQDREAKKKAEDVRRAGEIAAAYLIHEAHA